MDWSNEFALQFLEAYRGEAVLWDPTNKQHKDRRKLADAWSRLSEKFNCPVAELKRKRDSLMATFRSHLRRKKASLRSGAGAEDVYKPVWFAYNCMEEFLAPVYEITANFNTDHTVQIAEEEAAELAPGYSPVCFLDTMDDAPAELTTQRTQASALVSSRQVPATLPRSQETIRSRNPPELQEPSNQMSDVFRMLTEVVSKRSVEEDECDLYGKMLAKKLKKFPEDERELIMYEIDGLLIRRRQCRNIPSEAPTTPEVSKPGSSAFTST